MSKLGQLAADAYPALPHLEGAVSAADHAFASGNVFECPADIEAAIKLTGGQAEGELLYRVWRQFLSSGVISENVLLGCGARLVNERQGHRGVTIGHHCAIRGILRTEVSGRIDIGAFVYIGDNSIVYAREHVSIGEGTLIAHNVNIFDNDTHPIGAADRVAHFQRLLGVNPKAKVQIRSGAVTIGKRCWLATNSVVYKGVTIGDDTIVSANSVVSTDLPSGVIAAGIPATPIRSLRSQPPSTSSGPIAIPASGLRGIDPAARTWLKRLVRRVVRRPAR